MEECNPSAAIPKKAIMTRFYNNCLKIKFTPELIVDIVDPSELTKALNVLARGARRIEIPPSKNEDEIKTIQTTLLNWIGEKKVLINAHHDLRTDKSKELLHQIQQEANDLTNTITADLFDVFIDALDSLHQKVGTVPSHKKITKAIEAAMPVFIYFENYGILDNQVYLDQFVKDIKQNPFDPKLRTTNTLFEHVGLTASEIADLGKRDTTHAQDQSVTDEMISRDFEKVDKRAIKLQSASLDISSKFSNWYQQRRHTIRYDADGEFFRIWVSDDRRPNVEIELENRSKGFQWFFSFYLVFLVESEDGHKDAVLLLDEPGLHLHPTAQQELIAFFENLAEKNHLVYTTHSPFLIDGENIQRVRPVTEDETGHSTISVDGWPRDRETIFPLQAAAGYAMVRGLFQHKKNLLVEGFTDYLYLHCLNILCHADGRESLPEDIYITPCGGTKHVGHLASLFLGQGQEVRPVILLDGDDAGKARRDALMKELYSGHDTAVLLLGEVFEHDDFEIEDIVGEKTLLCFLNKLVDSKIVLIQKDRSNGPVVAQIKSAACRLGISLPDGWKAEIARRIVRHWSVMEPKDMPDEILDKAEMLFKEINTRFKKTEPSAV